MMPVLVYNGPMLLTIDVGNTCLGAAVFEGDRIIFRNKLNTPDRINIGFLKNLIDGPLMSGIESVIVSSVVPFVDHSLKGALHKLLGKDAFFIDHNTDTGIKLEIDHPEELGADRIADAVGGTHFSSPPLIILDSGTATTFDIVDKDYRYIGGSIFPGIELSIRSLASNTAKLNRIAFSEPASILGKNTEDNIRAGIYYCAIGGLEFMIRMYKEIVGEKATVIATGGVTHHFKQKIQNIDVFEPDLLYIGLKRIHERRKLVL